MGKGRGGGYYDRDDDDDGAAVAPAAEAAAYSAAAQRVLAARAQAQAVDERVDPTKVLAECTAGDPVVVAMDTTGSMGDFPRIIYDKLPMFYGQIMMKGWLADPAMSFAFFNHPRASRMPLQASSFAQGAACDDNLRALSLCGGGGGDEGYDLAAWFYAHRCRLREGTRGHCFIIGDSLPTHAGSDDLPYSDNRSKDTVPAAEVKRVMGVDVEADASVDDIFARLRQRFDVYFICRVPTEHGVTDAAGELQRHDSDGADIPGPMLRKLERWFGADRVLRLRDAKAIVDVMLCALVVPSGRATWEEYVQDMVERGQTPERILHVRRAFCPRGDGVPAARAQKGALADPSPPGGAAAPPAAAAPVKKYRACAGAVVFNQRGEVLVFERADKARQWQFPQGGTDGEAPLVAATRELYEETGLRDPAVKQRGDGAGPMRYDVPPGTWLERAGFAGQEITFFTFQLAAEKEGTAPGELCNLAGLAGEKREFTAVKWASWDDVVASAVPFRRPVYERLRAAAESAIAALLAPPPA